MLSSKLLRNNIDFVVKALKKRNFYFDAGALSSLEESRKKNQIAIQELQNLRNTISKTISIAKAKGEDTVSLLAQTIGLGDKLQLKKQELSSVQAKIAKITMAMPNIAHSSVPFGNSDADNVEISRWGSPFVYDFVVRDHVDLAQKYGLDFETASKISGARFVLMHGKIAKLHRALTQFMLDKHTEVNGYKEVYVPYLVNSESVTGTGQLPKFEADLFKTYLDNKRYKKVMYLIPTAEVPLTNIVRSTIVRANDLPLKFVASSPSFRSEAGAYGRDTIGLIRQHQFEKVELVQITTAEASYQALEELTAHAEGILQDLCLHYRKMVLCVADLGFSVAKTYDLEVWLPGQKAYREISSCSCCEDFQARRLQIRYKNIKTNKLELLHTLNGSGLAVGRTLVAVLENYQQADGSIKIPDVLQKYMNYMKVIK